MPLYGENLFTSYLNLAKTMQHFLIINISVFFYHLITNPQHTETQKRNHKINKRNKSIYKVQSNRVAANSRLIKKKKLNTQ